MEDDASRASAPSASASVLESRRESGRRSSRTSQTKSTRVEAYVERRKQQKEERAQVRLTTGLASRSGRHLAKCLRSLYRLASGSGLMEDLLTKRRRSAGKELCSTSTASTPASPSRPISTDHALFLSRLTRSERQLCRMTKRITEEGLVKADFLCAYGANLRG